MAGDAGRAAAHVGYRITGWFVMHGAFLREMTCRSPSAAERSGESVISDMLRCAPAAGLVFLALWQFGYALEEGVLGAGIATSALLSLLIVQRSTEWNISRHAVAAGYAHLPVMLLDGTAFIALMSHHHEATAFLWTAARLLELVANGFSPFLARFSFEPENLFLPYMVLAVMPLALSMLVGKVGAEADLFPLSWAVCGLLIAGFGLLAAACRWKAGDNALLRALARTYLLRAGGIASFLVMSAGGGAVAGAAGGAFMTTGLLLFRRRVLTGPERKDAAPVPAPEPVQARASAPAVAPEPGAHESALMSLLEYMPICCFLADDVGRIIYMNPFMRKRHGVDVAAGLRVAEFLPPKAVDCLLKQMDDVSHQGKAVCVECPAQLNGTICQCQRTLFPVRRGGGAMVYGGVSFDVTAMRQDQARMERNHLGYETLFGALNDGLFEANLENWNIKSVHFSPSWYRILGYAPYELPETYETWKSLLHPDDVVRVELAFWKSVRDGESYEAEYRMRNKSGEWCWVHSRGVFVEHDRTAARARIIGIHTDISDRKRMEEQLKQSEKLQAVGQLAGGIAHDFNNQLAAILGYAEMLLALVSADERLARYARVVVEAARHSADLTRKLLAFSRKGKAVNAVVNMHDVILETFSLLERSIDKSIALRSIFGADPATVMGDSTLLQNALLNLGLNARDAMPAGGTLTYATQIALLGEQEALLNNLQLEAGEYLRIDVTDTGCGMPPSTMARIFEPFFTTKPEGKGTGMGLAAVYGTAKEHQGSIGVASAVGKGSTFSLYLPLYRAPEIHLPNEEPRPATMGHGHILVIDDERMVRELMGEFCTSLGYTATLCESGDAGIAFYREHHDMVDLVVLDMNMPQKDGLVTFGELQEINPAVRVIILSGYSEGEKISNMLERGAREHISKPVSRVVLSEHIAKVLEHDRGGAV